MNSNAIATPVTQPDRRSMRSLIVDPKRQLRFSMLLLTAPCLCVMAVLMLAGAEVWKTIMALAVSHNLDADFMNSLKEALGSALFAAILLVAGILLVTVLIGIRFSHRIYGPMIGIRRYIDTLAAGDYKARLHLRNGDHFIEIRDALNALAAALEKRHKK